MDIAELRQVQCYGDGPAAADATALAVSVVVVAAAAAAAAAATELEPRQASMLRPFGNVYCAL